jgi:hypothetical protein
MEYFQLKQLREQLDLIKKGTPEEINYNAINMGLETIPTLGPLASYFYKKFVSDPAHRRICHFFEDLVDFLVQVEQQVNTLSYDSPTFQTNLMRSLQIVSRNHQQRKLIALRNLIANSALPNPPEEDLQSFFLSLIDEFQCWHLTLLEYCSNLDGLYESKTLDDILPNLDRHREYYNQVLKELSGKGLIKLREAYVNYEEKDYGNFYPIVSNPFDNIHYGSHLGMSQIKHFPERKTRKKEENIDSLFPGQARSVKLGSRTTKLGNEFLNFIKSPLIEQQSSQHNSV